MLKKFVFAFVMATIGALGSTLIATAAQTADDVFIDEGDGDFEVSDLPVPTQSAENPPPPPVANDEYADMLSEPPALEEPEKKPEMKPAQKSAPASVKKAVVKAEMPKVKQKKQASKPVNGGKGRFMTTKSPCPLLRQPASESEPLVGIKAPRKIWIEEVDSDWVRAFNSAGEPGYVSRECFE